MWFILAFAAFLGGAVYLLHILKRLDSLLAGQEQEREALSLSFEEPAIAEQLAYLLERFSRENPEVDLVLHTDPSTPAAVAENWVSVGFCGENTEIPRGLDVLTLVLPGEPCRKMIWNGGKLTPASRAFTRYLLRASGNGTDSVIE